MTTSFGFSTRKFQKKIKRFSIFFLLLFIIIFVLIVFNIADLFSSAITNKGSLIYGEKIRIPNTIYYGISLYSSSDESKSIKQAKSISDQGGAGFVYCMGDYYVFSSIYLSHEDAVEVKEKLLSDSIEAKIININIPVININYKGDFLEENTNIFSVFKDTFDALYNLTLEYDLGSITVQELKTGLNKLIADFSAKINNFDAIYKKERYDFQDSILKTLNELKVDISKLLTTNGVGLKLNSELKNVCCKIVVDYYNLAKNI